MRRRARFQQHLTLARTDGTTVEAAPGPCWIDDSADDVVITWKSGADTVTARITAEALRAHLAMRDLVYLSW